MQLRELAAAGFPVTFIAARVYMSPQGLGGIRSGRVRHTQPSAVAAVRAVYDRLHGTTPAQHGVPEAAAAWTRLIAARGGWGTTNTARSTR
jgi:hypothetical protein